MSLQVIGAGLGRTGTLSLKFALESLGFGKCYHMVELLQNRRGITCWERAGKQQCVDWNKLFVGYKSAVDFPACYYIEDLLEYYPQAKVILTIRDAEEWYESIHNSILHLRPSFVQVFSNMVKLPFSQDAKHFVRIGAWHTKHIRKKFSDRSTAIGLYQEHNERIKELVPADRLLIYEVAQGWEPLCEFLDCQTPNIGFPRLNRREHFSSIVKPLLW